MEDRYDTVYRLAPRGWITGAHYFLGEPALPVIARPKDRGLTMRLSERKAAIHSREQRSWKEIGRSPSVTVREIQLESSQPPEIDVRFL